MEVVVFGLLDAFQGFFYVSLVFEIFGSGFRPWKHSVYIGILAVYLLLVAGIDGHVRYPALAATNVYFHLCQLLENLVS